MGKLTEQEKQQWKELFTYIEKEILNYNDNQKLQKNAVLRLKGLSQGQVIANNKCEQHGKYSPEVLLVTFKINKNKIISAIKYKDFESEENKIAYMSAIVRDRLNDIDERLKSAKRRENLENNIDTSIIDNKGREYSNNKLVEKFPKIKHEDLW